MSRRVRVYWPRVRARVGPVGVSLGISSAIVSICCCGMRVWTIFL